jgi:predicted dehydrogenase/threonine dehydrogenase-like Zn-dependent dehydrogenase
MKQLLQNMRDGKTIVAEVPAPGIRPRTALVQTAVSLVSAGTERMVVEFAEKSLLGKARSRPDLVRQMFDKMRREGFVSALESAFNRLDQPMALGYSSAGTIIEVGAGLQGFHVGDRVACAGSGYAVHAGFAIVPQNLLIPLPPEVDFDSAAFATLGAIAMHGFRLAQPQIGERIAVIGLGLLGILTVGIARAAGCAVFGVDLDPERVELARSFGAKAVMRDIAETVGLAFTRGRGFDAVLITADAHSNDPIHLAASLARDRGRIVAVGSVGLNIERKVFYDKELEFHVSRSYGPGRYDREYEENGRDYPIGFVRWTEGRNLQAFIELLATNRLDVHPLISHRFAIDDGEHAYELITGKKKERFLGVLLTYPQEKTVLMKVDNPLASAHARPGSGDISLGLGVFGAGNYASAVFLPVLRKAGGISRLGIATSSGLSARQAMQRFDFGFSTSSEHEILENPNINVVAVLTRHDSHARLVLAALEKGKHVYCEKPLAINENELNQVAQALSQKNQPLVMVGFNRRFAPMAIKLSAFLCQRSEPLVAHYRVNAGYLPLNHWLHDPQIGGGRIIGEGCHFIDFLTFLVGAPPVSVCAQSLPDGGRYQQDIAVLTFTFPDGSLGTLHYLANGDKSFSKERVEVFCAGQTAVLDDFRTLELIKNGSRQVSRSFLRQDKGHRGAWETFLKSIRQGGEPPIPYTHLVAITHATLIASNAIQNGEGKIHPIPLPILMKENGDS